MKNIVWVLMIMFLFSVRAEGAYVQITNITGTATYGTLTATVTSSGSVTTWGSWCTTSYGTSYWAGSGGGGSYTTTFNHPVSAIKFLSYALNGGPYGAGEYLSMTVNGVFYPLTAANMSSYADCASGGICYLYTGFLYGPVGSTSYYSGGDFTIRDCSGITSFKVYCNGIEAGVTWYIWADTTFDSCFNATNNGPLCYGDTLKLHAFGGDTLLPYTWHGPGGYTSTGRNPLITNVTLADSGMYYVVQTIAGVNDTAWTDVHIKPKPVISDSSNSPLCPLSGLPLTLFAYPGIIGETFSWTGPSGYTSTLQNPVISPFGAADTGTFTVIADLNGCYDTAITHVAMVCFAATSNSAICYGDTLLLFAIDGDTTLPYTWYGPGGFTTVNRYPVRSNATFADSGLYFVTQTIAGIHDTAWTHVTVKPLPIVSASSNAPFCTGLGITLTLYANPPFPGETYSWTGPYGFISTLQNPTVPGFNYLDTGWYYVHTWLDGCPDSAKTWASLNPIPPPPTVTGKSPYCFGDPFIPFTVIGEPGSSFLWYTTGIGGTGSPTAFTINTSIAGNTTYWVSELVLGCESSRDSVNVTVLPKIIPSFTYGIHHGCDADTVYFTNTSSGASIFTWNFGDSTGSYAMSPIHHYHAAYPYIAPSCFAGTIILVDSNGYCSATTSSYINTSHPLNAKYRPVPDTICLGGMITFVDASSGGGLSYAWTFGDDYTDVTVGSVNHTYNTDGIMVTKLVITDSISCKDSFSVNAYVLSFVINSFHDTTLCLTLPLALENTVTPNLPFQFNYSHFWSPATNLTSDTAEVPFFSGFGDFHYTLTDTLLPFGCIAYDTIDVHSVLGAKFTNLTPTTTIQFGNSLQLNCDNEILYYWQPDNGTLSNPNINNPVASPSVTTTYTVYGTDIFGCLDSSTVTIIVDSAVIQFFPSGFSPNGDGLNDIFRPVGLTFQKFVELRIFNRWGQQVFYSNNVEKGWDGTFNGVPQDIDTYYYVLILQLPNQNEDKMYKGEVALIR